MVNGDERQGNSKEGEDELSLVSKIIGDESKIN